ncbi:MAG: LPS export ABC transporter periplasmic protein LptC [Alphaproteobacteria bacterium]|nr:LPS export ABC transporter periplasmic protein LptC [Alphaproteobacteria bacterium]
MKREQRTFIIFSKHKRLTRLLQFLFTGWGVMMLAALAAGALFTKQIMWTPIPTINMQDVVTNQFKMTNATFSGIDKDGNPFKIKADAGRQEYQKPDIIFLTKVSGKITHVRENQKVTDNVKSQKGEFDRINKTITLIGDVHVDSSNGDKMITDELVVQL